MVRSRIPMVQGVWLLGIQPLTMKIDFPFVSTDEWVGLWGEPVRHWAEEFLKDSFVLCEEHACPSQWHFGYLKNPSATRADILLYSLGSLPAGQQWDKFHKPCLNVRLLYLRVHHFRAFIWEYFGDYFLLTQKHLCMTESTVLKNFPLILFMFTVTMAPLAPSPDCHAKWGKTGGEHQCLRNSKQVKTAWVEWKAVCSASQRAEAFSPPEARACVLRRLGSLSRQMWGAVISPIERRPEGWGFE